MAYKSGEAYIQVTPSLSGWQREIRRQLKEELGNAGIDVPIDPEVKPGQASKDGEKYGGAFGDAARRRIETALRDLPDPKIGADSSEADRKIAALRARLLELQDKRINLELTDTQFLAEVAKVKAELDDLSRRSPDITVRVNAGAAAAELAALSAEVDRLDGRTIDIDTSRAVSNVNGLLVAGLALGPALIPVAAAITAAFGAIGTGAILGIGGIGTLGLAFSGVGDAVKELGKAHTATGQSAAQSAAQQLSAANAVKSAQEGVRSAQIGLLNAEDSLRRARQQAAVAAQNAASQVEAAIRRQRAAEQSLIDAQHTALRAQQELTRARLDAQRALEDLSFSVQDNALAQRRAQLDLQKAEEEFTAVNDPSLAGRQQDEARLNLDEARQRVLELQTQGKRLAADKEEADKAGVEGSRQVTAAQDAITAANERVIQAQEQVRLSAETVTKAQVDGARQVEQASQAVVQAERAVELAHQSVGAAVRSVAQAQAQQAAQAAGGAAKVDKLAEAMGKLSPAGQHFARFVHDELKPRLDELRATAQAGLLPGVEQGIRNAMPQFGRLNDFVDILATSFGDLATRAGAALNDPFWTGFFDFINAEAGPSTRTFGEILGNLATGAAGLLEAFKPVWDDMGEGLKGLTERFANFGKDAAAGKSGSFNSFLEFVQEAAPEVRELLSQLADLVGNISEAMAGQGLATLTVLNEFLSIINSLPPGTLRLLIDLFIAYKALQFATGVAGEISKVVDLLAGEKGVLGALKKIKAGGGLKGALAGGAGKAIGAAGVVGGVVAVDAATDGGIASTLNKVSGATPEDRQTGDIFGAPPAEPNDAGDIRNWPRMLTSAWRDARTELSGIWAGLTSDAGGKFGRLNEVVSGESQATTGNVRAAWEPTPGWLGINWGSIGTTATTRWQGITGAIITNARSARDTVMARMTDLGGWLSAKWDGIRVDAAIRWQRLRDGVSGIAQNVRDTVSGRIRELGDRVAGSFQWCIDRVKNIWDRLGNIAKQPVNFVIDVVYNRGIVPVWNHIAGVFGMGRLGPMRLLASGGTVPTQAVSPMVTNGPMAIVGEGNPAYPEYVIPTDPKFRGRARTLWEQAGGQLMAEGGIIGALQSGWDWATGLFTDPVGTARRLFASVTDLANRIPGAGLFRDALTRLPGKVVDAVAAAAKKLISTAGSVITGGQGSGVERWRPVGLQALGIAGQPASEIGWLLMQMRTESGGNPTAVNRTDINWQRGTPSVGLMQVIGPTYRAYRHPAFDRGPYLYGSSVDPLANILASTRYTLARYGSLARGWQGHGYDLGGIWRGGPGWNNSGKPERVLSPRQTESFEHLVDALTTRRGITPITLTAPQRAALSGATRAAGPDLAALTRAIGQEVQRAMASLDGARLILADDGRNGVARIVRRQERSLAREG